jgi:hypothetical protein
LSFVEAYLSPAFGSLPKSEIDLLVFSSMIKAGALTPSAPIYDIARAFNITPTRVRSMILNWQLRTYQSGFDLKPALIEALGKTRFTKDGTYMAFGIESPLVREAIIAGLKAKGVFADASFSREIVRLPVHAFVDFLDGLVDKDTQKSFLEKMVKDKVLEDTTFAGIAKGVLSKLVKKVAGDALGDAVADEVKGFLISLLKGEVDEAAKLAE